MAAEMDKREEMVGGKGSEEEKDKLLEGMTVLDFDMLCSTVAMQMNKGGGTLGKLDNEGEDHGGGAFRMWEGELFLDCFDDHRIALQSTCWPCYRFGKNMKRAGFGSCFLQGLAYLTLVTIALLNITAFLVTRRHCFIYLGIAFTFSVGTYVGFFRTQMRKKFNIRGSDSFLDDCAYHIICPCCTLCQESRTLEMNNVQDGIWHGRGDTICIGSYAEGSKTFAELITPKVMVNKYPVPSSGE